MPISNQILSNHRILKAQNPVFNGDKSIPTFQGSSLSEIVCKRFSSSIQSNTASRTMVQDWPLSKYMDIKPFVYSTQIDLPILLDKNGIRTDELTFFNNWLLYMTSTFDKIEGTGYTLSSLIVDSASIDINENDITLSLSFKSNFPLGWGPSKMGISNNKSLHARKAKYYDTYVKFTNYSSGLVSDNRILGWNNKYGVSNIKVDYKSEQEEICLSKNEFNSSTTIDGLGLLYPHNTDMLNVKSVGYDGNISIFGPEMETLGISVQTANSFNFNTFSQDIFSMSLSTGAIQLYIGGIDVKNNNYSLLTPLTLLPTGTVISSATTDFQGGQIYKHSRQFNGMFTNTPLKILQNGTYVYSQIS